MLRTLAAFTLSLVATPALAEDAAWTHFGQTNGSVMFILGGAETNTGRKNISIAVVPPPGAVRNGRPVGFYLFFNNVDCGAWTYRPGSTQYMGPDSRIFDQSWSEATEDQPIVAGSAVESAARIKCRAAAPNGQAYAQSQLIAAAARLR